jgi:archaellum biogenesis ATPase FlaH
MKQHYLLLLCLMILSIICFYYFSSTSVNKKIHLISRYDEEIKTEQDKLNSAKVLNEQLQEVSKSIIQTMTTEDTFNADEINDFVKTLATLADQYEIGVTSMSPKSVSTSMKYLLEQQYTLILNCTFIQMGQFLSQLESFDNITKIKVFDVTPISLDRKEGAVAQEITRYQVTLELSVFKIIKEV